MKRVLFALILGLACAAVGAGAARAAGAPEPLWAYGYLTPPPLGAKPRSQVVRPSSRSLDKTKSAEEQTRLRHVEGSLAAYSEIDIGDGGTVADWFPGDHPPMTNVMLHGPASLGKASWGCAYCHLPTGKGRPENAPVAGQSAAYILRQLEDFRNDARTSADPRKSNTPMMAGLAKAMTGEEMKAAAEYFAAIKWTPWTRVVETDRVPKTRLEGNLFRAIGLARTEPIAGRIIEVPKDEEQSESLRNPRSGFIAYVPVGSIKKGEILATTGTLACTACHGPDLMGLADMPGIAGRSPSYLVRQLYDLQQGTRRGKWAPLMAPVVANLTNDDMVAIAAYVASRAPRPVSMPRL
jgi:cytochrome c553